MTAQSDIRDNERADADNVAGFYNSTRSIFRQVQIQSSRRDDDHINNDTIQFGVLSQQGNIVSIAMNLFRKQQLSVLWCLPFLLLLSGCGDVGPDCGTPDARNSVLKSIADDRNNRLVNFAVDNSDSVAELLSHAKAEAEKSAIKDKAKQDAVYSLDDTIVVNSRNKGAAMCTGLLYVRVGDTTVQKEVDFKVEQTADGKTSVSVKPFQF